MWYGARLCIVDVSFVNEGVNIIRGGEYHEAVVVDA